MVLANQLKEEKIRKATIVFIDNELKSLKNYIDQVKSEGFENVQQIGKIKALSEVTNPTPALVILDLHGVAEHLDSDLHGLAVLDYIKKRSPFTKVIVYSGSDKLDVNSQQILQKADRCIKKGTISLKDFVCEVEDQVVNFYDPLLQRNVLLKEIENFKLTEHVEGFWASYSLKKALNKLKNAKSKSDFESMKENALTIVKYAKPYIEIAGMLATFIEFFS